MVDIMNDIRAEDALSTIPYPFVLLADRPNRNAGPVRVKPPHVKNDKEQEAVPAPAWFRIMPIPRTDLLIQYDAQSSYKTIMGVFVNKIKASETSARSWTVSDQTIGHTIDQRNALTPISL